MKKIILGTILLLSMVLLQKTTFAEENLGTKLSGRILLQIENYGKAWYVNPNDNKKYFLGRPIDAFNLMQTLGIGISNKDLNKIPIGFLKENGKDSDGDGLSDNLEDILKLNPLESDTDKDGYDDQEEILNNYNPQGKGKIKIDQKFILKNLGRIFLQVENNGEAWYLDPIEQKRYFLGRPIDAFNLMRKKALGITNENLNKINTALINIKIPSVQKPTIKPPSEDNNILLKIGEAIRNNNQKDTVNYFVPEMEKAISYTLNFLDAEGRFNLGNILSGAKLKRATENKKTYSTEVYFSLGGYKIPMNFYVEKQENGKWLLTNL